MTNEKLTKGNELQALISETNRTINEIELCLREIELEQFRNPMVSLTLNRTNCYLDTERLIEYLKKEAQL